MLPIRQHLGEDLDRARELLLGHRSNPGQSDLENQSVAGIEGSESDFPLVVSEASSTLAIQARVFSLPT